jgi:signal peptidase II
MTLRKAYLLVFLILLVDQISKIYVKTHFMLGEEVEILSWFRIQFAENEGMAWGVKLPGMYGKLFLTLFRVVAVCGIGYWLWDSIKNKQSSIYLLLAIVFILAGALGNILDSVWYGVIFDHSNNQVATLFSDQPYGIYFHGKVVDMFYFPIWQGILPSWLPFWGGRLFTFFNAIFNVADVSINIGILILIFFNKKAFPNG